LHFITNHPLELNLGKVGQTWFLKIVSVKRREMREGKLNRGAVLLVDKEVAHLMQLLVGNSLTLDYVLRSNWQYWTTGVSEL
jgi:hypothetical protein